MGDRVNLFDGSTEFSVSDIDLPGNGVLPVRLGRTYRMQVHNDEQDLGGFGAWSLDVPYVSANMGPSGGNWYRGAGGVPQARCSTPFFPDDDPPLMLHEIWSGAAVNIPGRGEHQLLLIADTGNPKPTDGSTYYWATRDGMRFRCTPALNFGGEGFVAVDGSGTQYFFNCMVTRDGGAVSTVVRKPGIEELGEPAEGELVTIQVHRKKFYLLATRVQDRFGNVVNYNYTNMRVPPALPGRQ